MLIASWLLYLSGIWPLYLAWRYNCQSSLNHAVAWGITAWVGWGIMMAAGTAWTPEGVAMVRYMALCLAGCAGIAVLGARHPGKGAWNFVVVGLLAVLLLPALEGLFVLRGWRIGPLPAAFLIITLAVGLMNYLPTRLGLSALILAVALGLELWSMLVSFQPKMKLSGAPVSWLLVGLAPWAGWLLLKWPARTTDELNRTWLQFRDRYGLVWGQRLREQFNRAAANSKWNSELGWFGMRNTGEKTFEEKENRSEMLATLLALMKRFGTS